MTRPGRRLFQFRDSDGNIRQVRAGDVNGFLRDVVGRRLSLKDFRMRAAGEPANTPAIRRKSYVHSAIVEAFEDATLARLRKSPRSRQRKAEMLARLVGKRAA
jgi:DNA topoisomerase-1